MKRLAGHFANETAVVTPNGKMLGHSPASGLEAWKKLPPSERTRLDDLGKYDPKLAPTPPRGGLILKVYSRPLVQDSKEGWQIYRNPKSHLTREPGRDFLWLTEEEWKSLLPARPQQGARFDVPAPLVDRFCRRYLIDLVREGGEGGPHPKERVVAEKFVLTVEEVSPAGMRLRLEGSARFKVRGREFGVLDIASRTDMYRLLGLLDYDARQAAFTRFDVVAVSPSGHYDEHARKVLPLGVAFELTPGLLPTDRVRPSSLYNDYYAGRK
jgi:hypothetical protein